MIIKHKAKEKLQINEFYMGISILFTIFLEQSLLPNTTNLEECS